ncbi:hypothetical protein GPJ56_007913 [Histomonas meleagridis]|uniref:uncharacterized protein n=1 Tax=Histomonas meleagridis TaxID=135588 RepID=UPI00355A961A|nr:hypothetical protein GPJ56_007913 [Histomonas meleagridis]KAH0803855.1 hypothetical protein GO595_002685 [Histomonas meleagridis]
MNDISHPKQQGRIILSKIEEELPLFEPYYILSFEEEKIFYFQRKPHPNAQKSILYKKEKPPRNYEKFHPSYSVANNSLMKIFRTSRIKNIKDIDFFDLPSEHCSSYYLLLRPKGTFSSSKNVWFIHTQNGATFYYVEEDTVDIIPDLTSIVISGKTLTAIQSDDEKKQFDIRHFTQARDLLNQTKSIKQSSFHLYALSILVYNTMPLSRQTRSFMRSIVENPQYLYLLSQIQYAREDYDSSNYCFAWIGACGFYLRTLLPLLLFINFSELSTPSLVLRSNSFLTYLLTTVIKTDPSFQLFLDAMCNLPNDSVVEYFADEFSKIEFQPLSRFILHCIYTEALRRFPNTGAEYFAVSGVIFLRLMSPRMFEATQNKAVMSQISHAFNFEQSEDDEIRQKLKKLIDQYAQFPEDLTLTSSSCITEDQIALLIKRPEKRKEEFVQLILENNFSEVWNKYKATIAGGIQDQMDG